MRRGSSLRSRRKCRGKEPGYREKPPGLKGRAVFSWQDCLRMAGGRSHVPMHGAGIYQFWKEAVSCIFTLTI
ncbi:hypothetical protein AALB47_19280 [Lachnospiraceae bacterium 54-11]